MKSTRSIMFPKMCLFKTDKFLETLKIYKFLKNDAGIFPPIHHPERIGKPHPRSRARTYLVLPSTSAACHRDWALGYVESWLVDKEMRTSLIHDDIYTVRALVWFYQPAFSGFL